MSLKAVKQLMMLILVPCMVVQVLVLGFESLVLTDTRYTKCVCVCVLVHVYVYVYDLWME